MHYTHESSCLVIETKSPFLLKETSTFAVIVGIVHICVVFQTVVDEVFETIWCQTTERALVAGVKSGPSPAEAACDAPIHWVVELRASWRRR